MTGIYVHRYVLRSASTGNRLSGRREFPGALVRLGSGFACLHPWPELGDSPLEKQIEAVAGRGEMTPLARRALACAGLDGEARERGESLFAGLVVPASHWLWNSGVNTNIQKETLIHGGFRAVKVKCDGSGGDGIRLRDIASDMPDDVLLRPDLNGALGEENFGWWIESLGGDVRRRIDFLEDPMPYDPVIWRKLAGDYGVDFGQDRCGSEGGDGGGGYRWRVVKPAVDEPETTDPAAGSPGLVFTSYLDHPVGQMFAACCAAREWDQGKREIGLCGLASHLWFEENAFSEALRMGPGGVVLVPEGTGLGFDELLESLEWERI